PRSVVLRHAKARVGIESVGLYPQHSESALKQLGKPYDELEHLAPGLGHVRALGQARAALLMVDGQAADRDAIEAIKSLATSLHGLGNGPEDGGGWWSQRVDSALLDGADGGGSVQLASVRQTVRANRVVLDQLEEIAVGRVSEP